MILNYMKYLRENYFIKILFAIIFVAFLFYAPAARAARLILETPATAATTGDIVTVSVYLNGENENLNAFEGKIIYPENFEFVEADDGDSLINLWVRRPAKDYFGVFFSGITPGGFFGGHGKMFDLKFKAIKTGTGEIGFTNVSILKNDGLGTPASVSADKLTMIVNEGVAVPPVAVQNSASIWEDLDPPESFVPKVAHSAYIFDDKWFISFVAQDKGSGVARYEKKFAKSRVGLLFAKWRAVESPYVVSDQNLQSRILIKAIDGVGNERIAEVAPINSPPWYENLDVWLVIAIIAIIVITMKIIERIIRKKFSK